MSHHETTPRDEWIGVAEVAAELNYSERRAWYLIQSLGIRCLGPTRNRMRLARFLRSDWEEARDRSLKPAGREKSLEPAEPGPADSNPKRRRRASAAPSSAFGLDDVRRLIRSGAVGRP